MATSITIFHVGEKVQVIAGPFKGMTGVVRAHTRVPTENIHIVDYDAPTEQQATVRMENGLPVATLKSFAEVPFSGPYGEFKPEELVNV